MEFIICYFGILLFTWLTFFYMIKNHMWYEAQDDEEFKERVKTNRDALAMSFLIGIFWPFWLIIFILDDLLSILKWLIGSVISKNFIDWLRKEI